MVKFCIGFRKPTNLEAFENTYQDFLALLERMPNLLRRQVNHVLGSPQGKAPYDRVLEIYFASLTVLQASLMSPQGQEAGKELNQFELGVLDVWYSEVYED